MADSVPIAIPNREVADVLDRVADLLEAQNASTYRVRAYDGTNYSAWSAEASDTTPAFTEGDSACE